MVCCVAVGCSVRLGEGKLMHRFPRNPQRRRQWEMKVKRKNWKAHDNSYICTDHFDVDQYEPGRADGLKKLKLSAIPTRFTFTKSKSTLRKPPKKRQPTEPINIPTKRMFVEHSYAKSLEFAAPNEGKPAELYDETTPDWSPSMLSSHEKNRKTTAFGSPRYEIRKRRTKKLRGNGAATAELSLGVNDNVKLLVDEKMLADEQSTSVAPQAYSTDQKQKRMEESCEQQLAKRRKHNPVDEVHTMTYTLGWESRDITACSHGAAMLCGSMASARTTARSQTTKGLQCFAINCFAYRNSISRNQGITFHKFPDKEKNKELYGKWVKNCRRDVEPTHHARLCSQHFHATCFFRTLQRTQLQEDAIPTLFNLPDHLKEQMDIKPFQDIKVEEEDPLSSSTLTDQPPDNLEAFLDAAIFIKQEIDEVEDKCNLGEVFTSKASRSFKDEETTFRKEVSEEEIHFREKPKAEDETKVPDGSAQPKKAGNKHRDVMEDSREGIAFESHVEGNSDCWEPMASPKASTSSKVNEFRENETAFRAEEVYVYEELTEDVNYLERQSENEKPNASDGSAHPKKADNRHRNSPELLDNFIRIQRDEYNEFGLNIARILRNIDNPDTFRRVTFKMNEILLDALAGYYTSPSMKKISENTKETIEVSRPLGCENNQGKLSDDDDPLGKILDESRNKQYTCSVPKLPEKSGSYSSTSRYPVDSGMSKDKNNKNSDSRLRNVSEL